MSPKQVVICLFAALHCQMHLSLLFAQSDWLLLESWFATGLFWLGEDINLFWLKSPSEVTRHWSKSNCKSIWSLLSLKSSGSWCKSCDSSPPMCHQSTTKIHSNRTRLYVDPISMNIIWTLLTRFPGQVLVTCCCCFFWPQLWVAIGIH